MIIRSDSEKAKPFRKWVTSEVLPSIRKHGAYMTQETLEKALTSPDFLIQLATNLKEEKQKRIEAEQKAEVAEQKIQQDAPKVFLPMPFQLLNVLAWLQNLLRFCNKMG